MTTAEVLNGASVNGRGDFVSTPVNLDNFLYIGNLPVVDRSKEEKLMAVLRKNLIASVNATASTIFMPFESEEALAKSKGYIFVECGSAEEATRVMARANGYALDKTHTLISFPLGEFERFKEDETEETGQQEDKTTSQNSTSHSDREYVREWLLDESGRDQFLAQQCGKLKATGPINQRLVAVYWNRALGAAVPSSTGGSKTAAALAAQSPGATEPGTLVHARDSWTETGPAVWSPCGTYLVSMHAQGVALWTGSTSAFEAHGRVAHPAVERVLFSPDEQFLLTWSPTAIPGSEATVMLWSVLTMLPIRGFTGISEFDFTWSPDSRFLGRLGPQGLLLYDSPEFGLVGKKAIPGTEGATCYAWSPSFCGNLQLAFSVPGSIDAPTRVLLSEVIRSEDGNTVSLRTLRTKNIFSVLRAQLFWHPSGDFLAIAVDRHGKNKKHVTSQVEIMHIRTKDIPVDVLDGFKEGELVQSVVWEPTRAATASVIPRLIVVQQTLIKSAAIVAADGTTAPVNVFPGKAFHVYALVRPNNNNAANALPQPKLLERIPKRAAFNRAEWSPAGDFFILAALDEGSASVEFWHADSNAATVQCSNALETVVANAADWDPSGRYLALYATTPRHRLDTGYTLYDARGSILPVRSLLPHFAAFAWRPRPPISLSPEQIVAVRKSLRTFSAKFDQADSSAASTQNTAAEAARQAAHDEYAQWRREVALLSAARCYDADSIYIGSPETPRIQPTHEAYYQWVEEPLDD